MKDLNDGDLRRLGRGAGGYSRRIRSGYLSRLSDVWSTDDGAVHQSANGKGKSGTVRKSRQRTNWKVSCEHGEVVAIEPNREFEHVFEGGKDPLMEALEYAAKQLRGGSDGG